jgi:hypothetical protein
VELGGPGSGGGGDEGARFLCPPPPLLMRLLCNTVVAGFVYFRGFFGGKIASSADLNGDERALLHVLDIAVKKNTFFLLF